MDPLGSPRNCSRMRLCYAHIEHMQKRAHEELIQRLITEKLQALGYFKHHNWNGHEYILAHPIP